MTEPSRTPAEAQLFIWRLATSPCVWAVEMTPGAVERSHSAEVEKGTFFLDEETPHARYLCSLADVLLGTTTGGLAEAPASLLEAVRKVCAESEWSIDLQAGPSAP